MIQCDRVLSNHGYHPLALFADGFLVEGEILPNEDLTSEIAIEWQQRIDRVFGGNIERLVRPTKDGIKISSQAIQHDRAEVLSAVTALLERKKAGFKLEKVQSDVEKWGNGKVEATVLATAIDLGLEPVANADDFAIAEGLKAAYLSYREIEPPMSPKQVWDRLAHHAGLSEPQRLALEPFDPLYGKALFAAKTAPQGMDGAIAALIESLEMRQGGSQDGDEVSEEMLDAVRRALNCPVVKPIVGGMELDAYINANPRQRCSLGATIGETSALGSDKMPLGTKIQMFSNRLPGGMTSDPVRQSEPMVALELSLAPEIGFPFILSSSLQVDAAVQTFGRVEGIPSTLQALLTIDRSFGLYTRSNAEEILTRLRCLSDLAIATVGLSKLDDCIYDLARACSEPFSLYFVLLRWILREQDEPNISFNWSRIREPLHTLLESLMPNDNSALTKYLRAAAQIAAEAKLWGSSAEKRTSLVEPFGELMVAARAQKAYMDLDFMFAALVQKYHTRLDRIRENGVGLPKLESLKKYYSTLRKLYEEVYQGRPEKILGDQKNLEAAYLFFLEEARRDLREKIKNCPETEVSASDAKSAFAD